MEFDASRPLVIRNAVKDLAPKAQPPQVEGPLQVSANQPALFDEAAPLSKFLLDALERRVDLATAEGRAGLLHEAKPLLRQMQATLLRVQLLRELGEKCRLAPGEVAQLLELAPKGAASRAPEPRYPRVAPAPIARALLRLLIANPTLAGAVTPEQQGLLDAAELAPVAELIGLVREGAIATPAMLIEATRDSSHSTLFQQVAVRLGQLFQTAPQVGESIP